MKKLSSSLKNMLLSLTIIAAAAAAILAFVHNLTSETIAKADLETLQAGIGQVTPEFDNNPYDEALDMNIDGIDIKIYPARMGGDLVGVAVESQTNSGFSGLVRVLVGIDMEGNIIDYTVLEQAETPGLGDQMDAWFRVPESGQSVLGQSLNPPLQVTKDGGTIDAISAATISSRAFLTTLNTAYSAMQQAINDGKLK